MYVQLEIRTQYDTIEFLIYIRYSEYGTLIKLRE